MIFTPAQLKDIVTLCELGAKVMSQEKPLAESANIQNTALNLLQKLHKAHEQKPEEPEV